MTPRSVPLTQLAATAATAAIAAIAPALAQNGTPSVADLDACVGQYELEPSELFPVPPRRVFVIRRVGQHLVARLTGRPSRRLLPVAASEFRFQDDDTRVTFARDARGEIDALTLYPPGEQLRAARIADRLPPDVRQRVDAIGPFLDWVRATRVRLPRVATQELPVDAARFLDEALQDKRVVFLGESHHYVAESDAFRLLFLRFLFERGWRHVGIEGVGEAQARRIDRFLETGDADDLPEDSLRPEFVAKLRAVGDAPGTDGARIEVFSFDVDTEPGHARSGYGDVEDALVPHRDAAVVAELLRRIRRPEDESLQAEVQRLGSAADFAEAERRQLDAALGTRRHEQLRASLWCLRDSLAFAERSGLGSARGKPIDVQGPRWRDALIAREQSMFRRMRELTATLEPDAKLVLIAHSFRLSRTPELLRYGPVGADAPPMWPSVGQLLTDELFRDETFGVWMLCGRGTHAKPRVFGGTGRPETFDEVADTLEELLARVGGTFLLPIGRDDATSRILFAPVDLVIHGDRPVSGVVGAQTDALFFVENVTARE